MNDDTITLFEPLLGGYCQEVKVRLSELRPSTFNNFKESWLEKCLGTLYATSAEQACKLFIGCTVHERQEEATHYLQDGMVIKIKKTP